MADPVMALYQAGLGDLCSEYLAFWSYSSGQLEQGKGLQHSTAGTLPW